jgi:hypothetical protein
MPARAWTAHLSLAAIVSSAGCGGRTSLASVNAGGDAAQPDGGLGAMGIPDPGPGGTVDVSFQSVEPNDTPQEATPLGTSTMGDVTVWMTNNTIGGDGNRSNYFVFTSGPTSGTFIFRGCFDSPITGMTATLWKVVDSSEQLPPVATASSVPDGPGMACLTFDQTVLEPNTVYLFGLTATGGAGQYSL